jgi:hypothetical protein
MGRAVISTDPTAVVPTWSAPESTGSTKLFGISCPATTFCIASGERLAVGGEREVGGVISTEPTTATHAWLSTPIAGLGYPESPASVSCASASLCVIAYRGGAIISTDPNAANPTWSAPATIDAVPAGTLSLLGSPATSGPSLTFVLNCSSQDLQQVFHLGGDGAPQQCPGQATLTTTERLAAKGHTVTGLSTAAKTKRHRIVVVGRATFTTLYAGAHSYKVSVNLNSIGKRLLTKFKRLPATLSVTAAAPELRVPPTTVVVKTVRVTFKAKTTSRHKH